MKTYLLFSIIVFFTTQLNAQKNCRVTISGDSCNFTNLAAHVKSSEPVTLKWKKDTVLMMVRKQNGYSSTGVVVAGGNGEGGALNQLYYPRAMNIDSSGNLFIAEGANNRITKWAPGATAGVIVAGGNGFGCTKDRTNQPHALALDSKGNIYVAVLCTNDKIMKWVPGADTGTYIISIQSDVQDMCFDKNDNLYLADRLNHKVIKYAAGSDNGVIVAGGNGQGAALNQLNQPISVFVDDAGNVYVGEFGNRRVTKWVPGANAGVIVAGGNAAPAVDFYFPADVVFSPKDLYVDKSSNVYILDNYAMRIQKWEPGEKAGVTIYATTGFADVDKYSYLNVMTAMTFDKNNNLYISDIYFHQVKKYLKQNFVDTTYFPTYPGNYNVTVTTKDGCTDKSSSLSTRGIPPASYLDSPLNHYNICKDTFTFTCTTDTAASTHYNWTFPEGIQIVSGQGTSVVKILPTASFTSGNLSLYAYNGCGMSGSTHYPLYSRPVKPYGIIGPATVRAGQQNINYSVNDPVPGLQYIWSVPPDAIINSGQLTDSVNVTWGATAGYISVTAKNYCGTSKTQSKYISLRNTFAVSSSNINAQQSAITAKNIFVYPNPGKHTANIQFANKTSCNYTLTITDVTGKVLSMQQVSAFTGLNNIGINVSELSKGIYFIHMSNDLISYHVQKFIKE